MEETPMMKIADLGPMSKSANVIFKVVATGDVREVTSRDGSAHTVADITAGDDTGTVILALWDENISKVEDGGTYFVKNGYTSLFRGSIRLNVGRYGELESSEEEVGEVKEDNNISDKTYPDERRRPYGGGGFGGGGGDYGRGRSGGGDRRGGGRGRWRNRF
jgi:replication factor A1